MSLIHAGGRLTRVGLKGKGFALDSGGIVGAYQSILVGGIIAVASQCLPVSMFSASSPQLA